MYFLFEKKTGDELFSLVVPVIAVMSTTGFLGFFGKLQEYPRGVFKTGVSLSVIVASVFLILE